MDYTARLQGADDVVHANAGCLFGLYCEIRWQMRPCRMRSFLVVMATPDPTDVIKVFFGHDNELVQALKLQCLDESFHMGPQVRRHQWCFFSPSPGWTSALHQNEPILRVVVPHYAFGCDAWNMGLDCDLLRVAVDDATAVAAGCTVRCAGC